MDNGYIGLDGSWKRRPPKYEPLRSFVPNPVEFSRDQSTMLKVKTLSSTGFDVLGVTEEYFEIRKGIYEVGEGMRIQESLRAVERHLAPDQRVVVEIDKETGEVISIRRPGNGYLDRTKTFALEGADDGMCWSNDTETTQFKVPDRFGKEKTIELDAPEPAETKPEKDDFNDRPLRRPADSKTNDDLNNTADTLK